MASRGTVLLLVAVICIGFAAGDMPANCCLDVADKPLPHRVVKSYTLQEPDGRCNIRAAVLTGIGGKTMCVPHPDVSKWVKDVIARVDGRKVKQ